MGEQIPTGIPKPETKAEQKKDGIIREREDGRIEIDGEIYDSIEKMPKKTHDDANHCGYYNAEDGSDSFGIGDKVDFSACNLKYGCRECRTEDFSICPVCKQDTGYVNDAGGVTFRCGHR